MATHDQKTNFCTPHERSIIDGAQRYRVDALIRGEKIRKPFNRYHAAIAYAQALTGARGVMVYAEKEFCGKAHGALVASRNSSGKWKFA